MYQKFKTLYLHHFKLVFALNFALSLYFVNLFYLKGFDKAGLYQLAIGFKLLAYAATVVIEKLVFSRRIYYYYNLGIGYRKILGLFFAMDLGIFVSFLILCALWINFI
jgi:hypothetical protein